MRAPITGIARIASLAVLVAGLTVAFAQPWTQLADANKVEPAGAVSGPAAAVPSSPASEQKTAAPVNAGRPSVVHTSTRTVLTDNGATTKTDATTECWWDLATGERRCEDKVPSRGMHNVTIVNTQKELRLDMVNKTAQVVDLPPARRGVIPTDPWSKVAYDEHLASGRYRPLGSESIGGKATLAVQLMPGEAPDRPYRTVRWLDTQSLLPVQETTYVLDQKTGEVMRAYGALFEIAERLERSSLPDGFFSQEVPSGYRTGPVTNG